LLRSVSTRFAGLCILVLGIWGGIIPFVGPYFGYSLGPDVTWHWTMNRLYLDVLPGIAAVVGSLMLIGSGPRPFGRFGALLALLGGAWFAVGPALSMIWQAGGAVGIAHGSSSLQGLEMLGYHTGLGIAVAALAAYALPGFLGVRASAPAGTVAAREGEAGPVRRRGVIGRRGVHGPSPTV
jgi:hypothetical protein